MQSRHGGRYNHPGALTVYLAEDLETCLAEKMFYFHREVINVLDNLRRVRVPPPFTKQFTLWEIELKTDVPDVADLLPANASFFQVFPVLMLNPSQDYEHLKDRRASIQSQGYLGIRAPSSRSTVGGYLYALFQDQSPNVQRITPFTVEFQLITNAPHPQLTSFINHATDLLDYSAGAVRIRGQPQGSPGGYHQWTRLRFNH